MHTKLKVGILGATGMVGQRFITMLYNHPWYEIEVLAASANNTGKQYKEAVKNKWKMPIDIPNNVQDKIIMNVLDINNIAKKVDFVFSAVDMNKDEIIKIEEAYAKKEIPVVSNNSACRMIADIPMVIPEINAEHFEIINEQRKRLNTKYGFIAVKPNCSIQSYAPMIKAWEEFEPYELVVSTYQAISGAGKTFTEWPEMIENIIPYIAGEETKSEQEPLKIFGTIKDNKIISNQNLRISCQCIRVPVLNGHTATVFIKFKKNPSKEDLIKKLIEFKSLPQLYELPSAPKQFIQYFEEDNRPQAKIDCEFENGMGISASRIRKDNIYDYKFIGLSHNTIRGAAGGALLCAELLTKLNYIQKKEHKCY